jgi:hypothetical protein
VLRDPAEDIERGGILRAGDEAYVPGHESDALKPPPIATAAVRP